jgi:hypothetical protein
VHDKDKIDAIMEILRSNFGPPEVARQPEPSCCDGPKPYPVKRIACETPGVAAYFIWTECVVINNGACPDWDFCDLKKRLPRPPS